MQDRRTNRKTIFSRICFTNTILQGWSIKLAYKVAVLISSTEIMQLTDPVVLAGVYSVAKGVVLGPFDQRFAANCLAFFAMMLAGFMDAHCDSMLLCRLLVAGLAWFFTGSMPAALFCALKPSFGKKRASIGADAGEDPNPSKKSRRPILKPTPSEIAGEHCIVCDKDECACPHEIRILKHMPEVKHLGEYWMRVFWKRPEGDDDAFDAPEEPHWYCSVCTQVLGKNGVKAARANAPLSSGAGSRITNSTGLDDVKAHFSTPKGNHQRAVDKLKEYAKKAVEEGADAEATAESCVPDKDARARMREAVVVPDGLLNLAVLCFAALVLPLSAQAFEKISRIVGIIGANLGVNIRHQSTYFFSELLLSLDLIIWESMICAFKGASQMALHLDGADDYLLLRVVLLSPSFVPVSMFWQARKMAGKCHEAVWQGVLNAFTCLQHRLLDAWYAITEAEFLGKVCVLVADGASELGVRRNGQVVESANDGDNFFHKMQARAKEVLGDSFPSILGYWCANHRIDLAPAAADRKFNYTTTLLAFFRSLTGHVMFSGRARGILDFLARALYDENGPNEDSTSNSLASLHRAPQRWLGDAKPCKSFVSRIADVCLYTRELQGENKKVHRDLGAQWAVHINDIRFYVVMPGISDLLTTVDDFNKKNQPGKSNVETVGEQLQLCAERLDYLCLRSKSEQNDQRPCEFVRILTDFYNGTHDRNPPQNASQLAKMLSKLEVQAREDKATKKRSKVAVYSMKYKVKGASKQHDIIMDLTTESMKDAIASLKAYGSRGGLEGPGGNSNIFPRRPMRLAFFHFSALVEIRRGCQR
jgi:hypothetical protein